MTLSLEEDRLFPLIEHLIRVFLKRGVNHSRAMHWLTPNCCVIDLLFEYVHYLHLISCIFGMVVLAILFLPKVVATLLFAPFPHHLIGVFYTYKR